MAWLLMSGLRGASAPARSGTTRSFDAVDTVIGWPPQATRLLTHRHRRACELLRQSVPEFQIFAQVPVARFIRVPTRMSYTEWLRRVGSSCVDLLVCDRGSNIVAVVEVRAAVDSVSESSRKRQQRVERVLNAVGIPLMVWEETHLPAPHEVRRALIPPRESPILESGSIIVPPEPQAARTAAVSAGRIDPGEPPRTTWFDELNATRPVELDPPENPHGALSDRPILGGAQAAR
jgi:Protein of unknown function (DUF2726)